MSRPAVRYYREREGERERQSGRVKKKERKRGRVMLQRIQKGMHESGKEIR